MNKFVSNIITALILIFAQGLFFNNINYLNYYYKYKNIKPLVIENPTLRDITEKRKPTLSYYKQNIITNNLI